MKFYQSKFNGKISSSLFVNKKNIDEYEPVDGQKSITLNTELIENHLDEIHTRIGWILAIIVTPVIIGIIIGIFYLMTAFG